MRSKIAVLGLALLCASCKVGPKYSTPAVPQTPAAFKELPETDEWKHALPRDGELKGKWWELFGDPRLNGLEEQVSISNQQVKQFEAQFRQARALVRANRANYFPTIGTNPSIGVSGAGGGRTGVSSTGSVTTPSRGTVQSYSLPFDVSWEPDLWGRIGLTVANAAAQAQASAADLENIRLSIQAELATDYFGLSGTDSQIKLLTTTLDAYARALKLTTDRYNGGIASRADVELAQTQLDSTKAQLTDIRITRATFEHAIALLTGHAPADVTLAPEDLQGMTPPQVPIGVPSKLLERRPDIASTERQVAAANANIGLARVAYYPSLTLSASAGLSASTFTSWFTWPARFWSVGPGLSQTLFDFGRRRAQVDITEAAYDSTVAVYRQTSLTAFQEVEDALANLVYLAQEAREQADAVRSSETSLRLELDRYKGGTASYLDVIQTQVIALSNERASVTILQRRMIAAVNLIRALGGGWDASQLPSTADVRAKKDAAPQH